MLPLGVIVGVLGFAFTVTVVPALVREHPPLFVTVTVYVPAEPVVMLRVVCPLLHK